jgi:phosphoserine phosphatase RsbU/P
LDYPSWPEAPVLTLDPSLEIERQDELRSLKLLDTEPESRFDRITQLAAEFFSVPTAYVAFIDDNRQWYKSRFGFCEVETTRAISFCQYTIHRDEPLVISDARVHPIGQHHPMVVGEPFVRFYAGVPLSGPRGRKIGTFCIVDTKPREFDKTDVASLIAFASLVEREINLGEIIETQRELLETRQELVETQEHLKREFSDAAKYVQLMLPPPLDGEEIIDWQFHPSIELGGDGLGYRRVDEDRIAFYVLDVTGHGFGSALLAVTALELLRNRNPASMLDFGSPTAVIERLNRSFQMKDHAGKFFSVWYGVYSRSAHTVTFANAGHPPALMLSGPKETRELDRTSPGGSVLGVMPDIHLPEITIPFPPGSELLVFTDGLYELLDPQGGRGSYDEFFAYLQGQVAKKQSPWEAMLSWLDQARAKRMMDDDVSLLRFATRA